MSLSWDPRELTYCFSRASLDSLTNGIRVVIRLGGGGREAVVDPGIESTLGCENSHWGRGVGFKCEWLSATINEKNVGFIRDATY
jgi:hypothetical protein